MIQFNGKEVSAKPFYNNPKRIGREGPIPWPTKSPNMTVMDFFGPYNPLYTEKTKYKS